jgi:hypothetical protein
MADTAHFMVTHGRIIAIGGTIIAVMAMARTHFFMFQPKKPNGTADGVISNLITLPKFMLYFNHFVLLRRKE